MPISDSDEAKIQEMHAAAWRKLMGSPVSLAENEFNALPVEIKRKCFALNYLFTQVKKEKATIDKFIDSIPD